MSATHARRVDGVEVHHLDAEGPLTADLLFRVGAADETVSTLGLSHLLEHLALDGVEGLEPDVDGESAMTYTVLRVRGTPERVADRLERICARLSALAAGGVSDAELAHARRVLEAEGGGPMADGPHAAEHLHHRLGAAGFGLGVVPARFLARITPAEVADWAGTRFTAGNAMLVLSGPARGSRPATRCWSSADRRRRRFGSPCPSVRADPCRRPRSWRGRTRPSSCPEGRSPRCRSCSTTSTTRPRRRSSCWSPRSARGCSGLCGRSGASSTTSPWTPPSSDDMASSPWWCGAPRRTPCPPCRVSWRSCAACATVAPMTTNGSGRRRSMRPTRPGRPPWTGISTTTRAGSWATPPMEGVDARAVQTAPDAEIARLLSRLEDTPLVGFPPVGREEEQLLGAETLMFPHVEVDDGPVVAGEEFRPGWAARMGGFRLRCTVGAEGIGLAFVDGSLGIRWDDVVAWSLGRDEHGTEVLTLEARDGSGGDIPLSLFKNAERLRSLVLAHLPERLRLPEEG